MVSILGLDFCYLLMGMHQLERIVQLQRHHTAYSCKEPCTMLCTNVVLLLFKKYIYQNKQKDKKKCMKVPEFNYFSSEVEHSSSEQSQQAT